MAPNHGGVVSVAVLIVGNLRIRHEIKRKSALTFDGGVKLSHPFEVSDHSTYNANDVIRARTEVVVPRSRSSPHNVILHHVRIKKHTKFCAKARGGTTLLCL